MRHSPKGLRISDAVHRALRIRAAETGESMSEIAERALRRELGMDAVVADPAAQEIFGGVRTERTRMEEE